VSRKKIALISTYTHPSRDSVEHMLANAFPEYPIENFSIVDVVKQSKDWIPQNLWYVGKEFGYDILLGRSTVVQSYFRTTYLFERIRQAMRRIIDPERHVFSFQTQSMYDTFVPGLPHFIYTDHTHLSNLRSSYFDRRWLRSSKWIALERTIYHHATRIFTRSSDVSADLTRFYDVAPDKVVCVFAGSNVPVVDQLSSAGDTGNRNVLFVGNDWERKGGPVLIEAFRQVLRAIPDATLTIAGARRDLDVPNCTWLGQVPLDQLSQHYSRAAVFCLPTRLEPFGTAVVEAMMHKLPVVASRVGAIPEIVDDGITGDLVPPGDATALAQALIRLLQNPAHRRGYGEAGYHRAIGTYTWDRVGQRIRRHIMPLIVHPATNTAQCL
jgi:glycosyltransferase involved in cell wall biosynthesis